MKSREKLTTKERRPAAASEPAVQSASDRDSARAAPVEHPDDRQQLIAVHAYYLAEARGFSPGAELDDWLAAEAQVDSQLRETRPTSGAGQPARWALVIGARNASANLLVTSPPKPLRDPIHLDGWDLDAESRTAADG